MYMSLLMGSYDTTEWTTNPTSLLLTYGATLELIYKDEQNLSPTLTNYKGYM